MIGTLNMSCGLDARILRIESRKSDELTKPLHKLDIFMEHPLSMPVQDKSDNI